MKASGRGRRRRLSAASAFGRTLLSSSQGLAPSREKARALILAGEVLAGDRPVDKAGDLVDADGGAAAALGADALRLARRASSWRTRSTRSRSTARGWSALDVGASTGGFTDCLLQRGAARVYCVDVGARAARLEGRLGRARAGASIAPTSGTPGPICCPSASTWWSSTCPSSRCGWCCRRCRRWRSPGAPVVALVKPQFEVGRADVGKGGIVRDEAARARALAEVRAAAGALGLRGGGDTVSPITGGKGNVEFSCTCGARLPA